MDEYLKLIEKFFKDNLIVKKILFQCQPPREEAAPLSNDKYVVDYVIINYSDRLLKAIKDIRFYIFEMLDITGLFENDRRYVENLFDTYEQQIINCGSNFDRLCNVYKTIFFAMREELVKEVGKKCYGYGGNNKINLKSAKTINELLHVIHSSVCNNEELYAIMPHLGKKINYENYSISLWGDNYDLAKDIFDRYPLEMSCGKTDILGLKNSKKILMMIRDRGHSLSIEITEESDRVYVNYFIPKICNMAMVNSLKGVTKVNEDSRYTVGVFSTTKELLAAEIIDFISKVPMDYDMATDPKYERFFR